MSDDMNDILTRRGVIPDRPLLGVTVLVVEDSRFAAEALRLLCMRSGARIRRADSLAAAQRHLQVYRPTAAIVDLGLPDGRGEALIAAMAQATPRVPVLLGMSGDDGAERHAHNAGADGFLAKPVTGLAAFQQAILSRLPADQRPARPRSVSAEQIVPDPIALRDDMVHAADLLAEQDCSAHLDYLAQFVGGVARSARDMPLERAAAQLARRHSQGEDTSPALLTLSSLVTARIGAAGAV